MSSWSSSVIVRGGIEQSCARIVVGATAARADIVDAGVARQIAAGLIAPGTLALRAAAERAAGSPKPWWLPAHHRADAAEQQRSADHAGRRRRRGSQKRAAAAHRRLRRAIGLTVRLPGHIVRATGPAASPGRCSIPGGRRSRAAARSAPSRAAGLARRSFAHRIEKAAGLSLLAGASPASSSWMRLLARLSASSCTRTVCTSA